MHNNAIVAEPVLFAQLVESIPTTRPKDSGRHAKSSTGFRRAPLKARIYIYAQFVFFGLILLLAAAEWRFYQSALSLYALIAPISLLTSALERYLSAPSYATMSKVMRSIPAIISWIAASLWFLSMLILVVTGTLFRKDDASSAMSVVMAAILTLAAMYMTFTAAPMATVILTWRPSRSARALFAVTNALRYITLVIIATIIGFAVIPQLANQAPQVSIVATAIVAVVGFWVAFHRESQLRTSELDAALSAVFVHAVACESSSEYDSDVSSDSRGKLLLAVVNLCDSISPASNGNIFGPLRRVRADGPVRMLWEQVAKTLSQHDFGQIAHFGKDILESEFKNLTPQQIACESAGYALHLKRQISFAPGVNRAVARDSPLPGGRNGRETRRRNSLKDGRK